MLLIVRVEAPVFVTVTACAVLVVFRAWFPNGRAVGDRPSTGSSTVPVSGIDSDVAGAAALTFNVAVLVLGFALPGRNVTVTVQLAPAARAAGNGPQLLPCANATALPVPKVKLTPVSVAGPLPLFVTVTT